LNKWLNKKLSAFFNDVTYVSPKVPTLYTVLSTGPNATDPVIYGTNTNAFVLAQNQVVEIVLNNMDPGKYVLSLSLSVFFFFRFPQCRT
jgi:iron transport multicopper oxidase